MGCLPLLHLLYLMTLLMTLFWCCAHPDTTPHHTTPTHHHPPPIRNQAVLWGIFAAVALGAALSALRLWWLRRPLTVLRAAKEDPEAQRNLRNVVRFQGTSQVEVLARVMRRWDDDGQPDEAACALGEFVYKVR